ncbi:MULTISPECIES: hypothetical protein [Streptomyces violaceoruber group]|nr:hypothetical protein [Streptomyces anthocyanicus]
MGLGTALRCLPRNRTIALCIRCRRTASPCRRRRIRLGRNTSNVRKRTHMSLGDEPIKGGRDLEPAEESSLAGEEGPAEEVPGRRTRFSVVVSDNGSATIDGEHVRVEEGEPVHAAILDILHNIASDLSTVVTAAISDPATEYTALVEISPDGSSRLLGQEEPAPGAEPPLTPGKPGALAEEYAEAEEAFAYSGETPDTDRFEPVPDDVWPSGPQAPSDEGESYDDFVRHPDDGPDREGRRHFPSVLGLRRSPNIDRERGPRQSGDEYERQRLLNRPLVVGPMALLAAAAVIVPLLLLGSGGSGDDNGDQRTQAGSSSETRVPGTGGDVPPTVSLSPSTPSAPPRPKVSASASTTEAPGAASTRKAPEIAADRRATTSPDRPPRDTAAVAVKRLADGSSSSRHICYRAYLAGQGWQTPVCDGKVTAGADQDLPIKALNIAMTGVGGSSANAFTYKTGSADGRGEWNQWTAVVGDGKDNYIGSTRSSAPKMLGFAINIGKGQLCHVARVHNSDGGHRACVKARPAFTFGGSLLNKAWLRSVEFTV